MMTSKYYTQQFRTTWPDTDNMVISLYELGEGGTARQVGIIELRLFKTGEQAGECYLWNLQVAGQARGRGYGRALLGEAIDVARREQCRTVTLEWTLRESPQWVFDWYVRQGFDEREIGPRCAFMAKDIGPDR